MYNDSKFTGNSFTIKVLKTEKVPLRRFPQMLSSLHRFGLVSLAEKCQFSWGFWNSSFLSSSCAVSVSTRLVLDWPSDFSRRDQQQSWDMRWRLERRSEQVKFNCRRGLFWDQQTYAYVWKGPTTISGHVMKMRRWKGNVEKWDLKVAPKRCV